MPKRTFRNSNKTYEVWEVYNILATSSSSQSAHSTLIRPSQRWNRAIREFYENDYWPMVNAIREEFGLGACDGGLIP